ncbi:MAG: alpha/beta hydrolase [Methylococcus sp.]|nr:alpha/beta hydrolase [Methylococcus sp.]
MKQPLNFRRFGADYGRVVIYFHGVPGAPEECAIFDAYAKEQGLTVICFDRFSIDASMADAAYYQFLAGEISRQAEGRAVDIVGFSIGAFVALQTCRYMAGKVRSLHLISAAAPLDGDSFLGAMAGKRVFQLARVCPAAFGLMSYWQGFLASFFPFALFRMLFASAAGEDKKWVADREFKSGIAKILKSCFAGGIRGYARDMRAYVRPWKDVLSEVSVNTYIWHGAEDNWSPKDMAEYLKSAIPGCVSAEIFSGLSHYSCLYRAAPEICDLLGEA